MFNVHNSASTECAIVAFQNRIHTHIFAAAMQERINEMAESLEAWLAENTIVEQTLQCNAGMTRFIKDKYQREIQGLFVRFKGKLLSLEPEDKQVVFKGAQQEPVLLCYPLAGESYYLCLYMHTLYISVHYSKSESIRAVLLS